MDVGIVLALGVVVFTVLWLFTRKTKHLQPSPPGRPMIGHIGLFKPEETLKAFNEFRKELGDIFTLRILHKYTIIVNGYENIREILVGHADVTSDRSYSFIGGEILGNGGIIGSSGRLWREHRKFGLASMRKFDFGKKSIEGRISEEIEVYLGEITRKNGHPFSIWRLTEISVSNIIAYIVFGKRFQHTDPRFNIMIESLDKMESLISFQTPLNLFPSLKYIPGDPFNAFKVKKLFNVIFQNVQSFIGEHRETYDADNMRDYIDCYLQEHKRKEETGEKHTFSVCLGEELAKMEIFLFITAIVQRFDIKFEAGKRPPTLEPAFELNVVPQEYNICLVPRTETNFS